MLCWNWSKPLCGKDRRITDGPQHRGVSAQPYAGPKPENGVRVRAAARHMANSFGASAPDHAPCRGRRRAFCARSHCTAHGQQLRERNPQHCIELESEKGVRAQCGEAEKAFCAAMAVSGFAAIEVYKMIFYCLSHFHPARARYCGAGPHCRLRNKNGPPARAVIPRYMPDLQRGEGRSHLQTPHGTWPTASGRQRPTLRRAGEGRSRPRR